MEDGARNGRRIVTWIPFAFVVGGLLAALLLAWIQPEPITAKVLSVRGSSHGFEVATVEWTDADGTVRVDLIEVPDGYEAGDEIPIWPEDDVLPTRYGEQLITLSPGLLGGIALVSFLLGLVTDLSVRGFGYVRTSRIEPEHLEESKGFYWRT